MDNLAPEIIFNKNPVQYIQNVSVQFTVKDRAWKTDDYSLCSGIKTIEFWDGAQKLYEIQSPTDTCTYSDTVILAAPSSSRITIKAYDMMNQLSTRTSSQFILDTAPPEIEEGTFRMKRNGVEINEYMSSGDYDIDASIIIREQSLSPSNVRLDLSDLGGSISLPATICEGTYGVYTCTWKDAEISASFDKSVNMKITAQDDFGNSVEKTINRTYKIDATSPSVVSIETSNIYEGKSYIGLTPVNITMTLAESGAGLSNKNVYLDLSDVSPIYGVKQADECRIADGLWKCAWTGITTAQSGETVAVVYVISTYDDAGNQASGLTRASISVDKRVPQFVGDPKVKTITKEAREDIYILSGDDLEIELKAEDSSALKMYADFSEIYNELGSDKDRKSTRLNSSHTDISRMPSSA